MRVAHRADDGVRRPGSTACGGSCPPARRSPTRCRAPSRRARRACSRLSSTSAAAPSLMTKPSRVFSKGRDAPSRVVVARRQRRQQREADHAPPAAPTRRRRWRCAASASPRWIASTAIWMAEAPGGAGRGQRDRRAARAEARRQAFADAAEQEGLVQVGRPAATSIASADRSPLPLARRARSKRCGHSYSTGGMPTMSGPGKRAGRAERGLRQRFRRPPPPPCAPRARAKTARRRRPPRAVRPCRRWWCAACRWESGGCARCPTGRR